MLLREVLREFDFLVEGREVIERILSLSVSLDFRCGSEAAEVEEATADESKRFMPVELLIVVDYSKREGGREIVRNIAAQAFLTEVS